MEYVIIYLDSLSNEIERHRAKWSSEVCVIVNTGLEQGYDVMALVADKNE